MALSLLKLIARTQAAIDVETDPKKLRPLQANLAAFLVTKAAKDEDDGPDSDRDDEDKDESKSEKAAKAAKAAKGKAEAAKHRAKAAEHKAKAAESEEAAKAAENGDDEEKESEEAAAVVVPAGHDALLANLAKSVEELKKSQASSTKATLIDGARKLGAITKTEAAWLGAQALSAVETFLEMRSKTGLVTTDEGALIKPKHVTPGTEESLPAATLEMIESACAVWTGDKKVYREELIKAHLAASAKQVAAALDGAGRY